MSASVCATCALCVVSHGSCVLDDGRAFRSFAGAVAMAVFELDGWYRGRLGDSAAVVWIRRGLVPVSGDRLSRRRSAFRCSGNMDVRPQHRMELFQASAADGMGRARMDVGV